jgi:RNA polymerase sigma factor (TIGR02999 family)
MNGVTRLIERIKKGDRQAADELLPIVYNQLRDLARKQLADEAAGHSLQSADLVHEAYLRLLGTNEEWDGRGHFLAAAAEAMRRILVERARKKRRVKHGGHYRRVELNDAATHVGIAPDQVIMVSDLLDSLGKRYALEALIVKLHYFAGLNISEAGKAVGVSSATAYRYWLFARSWLHEELRDDSVRSPEE